MAIDLNQPTNWNKRAGDVDHKSTHLNKTGYSWRDAGKFVGASLLGGTALGAAGLIGSSKKETWFQTARAGEVRSGDARSGTRVDQRAFASNLTRLAATMGAVGYINVSDASKDASVRQYEAGYTSEERRWFKKRTEHREEQWGDLTQDAAAQYESLLKFEQGARSAYVENFFRG